MATIWLISDTHFGHANILRFCRYDGTLLRPGFSTVEEMDDYMVEKWNSVVKAQDHIYHLGDVVMDVRHLPIMCRLNGHKRLVLGNHDDPHMRLYAPYFEKIFSMRRLDNLLLTHVPVHPESLDKKLLANVHGHVHNNVPQGHFGQKYYNVSVEMLDDYTPITLEDLKVRIQKQLDRR